MAETRFYRSVADSPLGPVTLIASERGARAILWGDAAGPEGAVDSVIKTRKLARQLEEYFAGRRRKFELELDLSGTPFREKVWRALLDIPYGATASYGDLARAIGQPTAYRAVGGANRANPLPIVVPCHRVIGSDGDLVGYAGRSGLKMKAFLLALESSPQPQK